MSTPRSVTKMRTKMKAAAFLTGLAITLSAGPASAGPHDRQGDGGHVQSEIRIYGTVQKIPDGLIGKWNVGGKEITVTKDTRIREKHGKAETGAFVEIGGFYNGNIFNANEIKVRKARQ